jgi:hypothetical protein
LTPLLLQLLPAQPHLLMQLLLLLLPRWPGGALLPQLRQLLLLLP